jgi:Big-like domain-containing protein
MRIGSYLHRLAARVSVAAVAVLGVVFFISGVASATSLRSAHQATAAVDPTATKIVLTASPDSPVPAGTVVEITATVTPPAPGSVTFNDGDKPLKTPVYTDGKAGGKLSYLTPGRHQLSAEFKPDDPKAYKSSSAQLLVTVKPVDTRTALAASATSVVQGNAVSLVATVTPNDAAGAVQLMDGSTALGPTVTVTDGTASTTLSTSALAVGSHTLTAAFKPTDDTQYNASTSSASSLTVLESPQTVTSPAQTSGQSLDGTTTRDDRGGAVVNLDLGGLTDGRGVSILDGGNASDSSGLTLLNLDLGGRSDRSSVTLLDGRDVTVLREHSSEGLLSALLHALL